MQSSPSQIIVYDDACPMCTAYTGLFVRLGWVSRRIPFTTISPELLKKINLERGRHEIPLYDYSSGRTIYGLQALFALIGSQLPWLQPILANRFFYDFWKQVYWIITYNRRIIAGSPAPASGLDCGPDRHIGYRWVYIILLSIPTVLWLGPLIASSSWHLLPLALACFLLIGGLLVKRDRLSWLGHWITIGFLIALTCRLVPDTLPGAAGLSAIVVWLLRRRWAIVR